MIDIRYYWQVSKYKEQELPLYGEGAIPSWTSVSDIGKVINGKVLTVNEYLTVENLYIQAIKVFMMCSNTNALIIEQLEKPFSLEVIKESNKQKGLNDSDPNELYDFYQLATEGAVVGTHEVEYLSRLALRENLWAQLQCESMFLRFDYDYYIDIGSIGICEEAITKIREWGLTINQWDEPYPFDPSTN
ncbi:MULTISPECIES: hypothetical protein [Brevibacillus]|uniref:hypothetical protein n=1 Tax=Brevibacillus TaxID=55080 RepID=UPI000E2F991C|nr:MULTISPECIES: hypothetical protein [Brevibacillus]MBG9789659.1 hypothetical protein [Brevibacillus laterosporus]MED1790087.1 hypothetical protein [Brevibacillus laterosporus]RFB33045.1 hypothetical protein DZB91_14735 [Brevibacillus sp. VP]